MLSGEKLERAIEIGDRDALRDLVASLPASGLGTAAAQLAQSDQLDARLLGLNMIVSDLARGRAPKLAIPLAQAIHAIAIRHLDDPEVTAGVAAEQAGVSADALIDAYALGGQHDAIVKIAQTVPPQIQGRTNGYRERSIRMKGADAMIALNRLEEAEREVNALAAGGADADPNFAFLRARLADRLQSATRIKDHHSADQSAVDSYRRGIGAQIDAIEALAKLGGMNLDPQIFAGLRQQADAEKPETAAEVNARAVRGMQTFAPLLGAENSDLWTWRNALHEAQSIFHDPVAGHDPARLQKSLHALVEVQARFEKAGHREDARDTLWPIHLCQKRLNRVEDSLKTMLRLARQLETERAQIDDPVRRSGLSATFPYLYSGLAEAYDALGDSKGLLSVIEAAKGRTLADLLTRRDGAAAVESDLRSDPEAVSNLTKSLRVHYLTFLADDDCSYAVLVTKRGAWHRSRIDVGRKMLAQLARTLDPKSWRKTMFGAAVDPMQQMAPLLDWLAPLWMAGEIEADDHLIYSADEHLHQFPLHAVPLAGEPIVARLAVTRVHGLAALHRAAARTSHRPDRALALFIPAADEGEPAAKKAAFAENAATLKSLLPVTRPRSHKIDAGYLAKLDAKQACLHISGHGVFPEEGMVEGIDPNPYLSAGILLAANGSLPARAADWPARLTPQFVFESALELAGAHVTLEGCVSGLAKEGIGGDALGLEWALLAKGADSVLATHWHVNFDSAARFSQAFYQGWLRDRLTRAQAWRAATLKLRADPAFGQNVKEWAGFSLTGEWR